MKKKKSLLAFFLMFCSSVCFSQLFTISYIQLAYLNTLGKNYKIHEPGLGGGVGRMFNDKFGLSTSWNLYFGGSATFMDTATAYYSANPPTVLVEEKRKVIAYTGELCARYYVMGDQDADYSVYALAGVGIYKASFRTKSIGSYDQTVYHIPNSPQLNDLDAMGALSWSFGAGYEHILGRNNLFFVNACYHHFFSEDTGVRPVFYLPGAISVEAGLRFTIF